LLSLDAQEEIHIQIGGNFSDAPLWMRLLFSVDAKE
jgi:hypothetical protein